MTSSSITKLRVPDLVVRGVPGSAGRDLSAAAQCVAGRNRSMLRSGSLVSGARRRSRASRDQLGDGWGHNEFDQYVDECPCRRLHHWDYTTSTSLYPTVRRDSGRRDCPSE